MKIPEGFELTLTNVAANRDLLNDREKELRIELKALEGLNEANQAICRHGDKSPVYDPGYAGGGQDGYRCNICGKRGYF